jgi:hypothetical protein
MTDISPAADAPSSEKPSSSFSRLVGVLFSPTQTFTDIARKPDWIVPALAIIVVSFASILLAVPRLDFEGTYREAFEARHMTPQQIDQAMRFTVAFAKGGMYVSPFLLLGFVAVAALIYFLGVRMFGGAATYMQVFSVVLYSYVPRLIRALINIPVVLSRHGIKLQEVETVLRSNLGFLVDYKTKPVLFAFLAGIDVFNIWSLVLVVIGLSIAAKLSKAKTAVIVIVVWLLGTLVRVGGAAMGAMRAAR